MAQTRPSPTLSRGFTRLGRFLAPYGVARRAFRQLDSTRLSPGLGARHAAALAITTATNATAVVISASSGTVLVYDNGQPILELERAQSASRT